MKKFIKNNVIVWLFIFMAIIIELLAVWFVEGKPLLTKPWYFLFIISFFTAILLIINNKIAQIVISSIILIGQAVLGVGMLYLYDSNGTYFEYSMLNQRNDAFGTIESYDFNMKLITIYICIISIYLISSILIYIFTRKNSIKQTHKSKVRSKIITASVLCLSILLVVLFPVFDGFKKNKDYVEILYRETSSKYQQIGITANSIYEVISGNVPNNISKKQLKNLSKEIYGEEDEDQSKYLLATSEYNGVSKGNNLVYILVESFEWYAFLNEKYDQKVLKSIYPNIYRFMENSLLLDNFYAREKTDTSEMLSMLGSNPTGKYINYDFPENNFAYSIPNLFKESVEDSGNTLVSMKTFHHAQGGFYNRRNLHKQIGFDQMIDINIMEEYGVKNTFNLPNGKKGDRTLDSQAFDKMRDLMFPNVNDNEQFFTYILSFTTHGFYKERENLKNGYNGENYYDTLDLYQVYPEGVSTMDDYLRTYCAALMDFDRGVGIMLDTLESKGLLDRTTIVMFSDHNTYYNNLAYFAKDIDEKFNSELYRIPCMIYDQKLLNKIDNNGQERVISKFTTTSDLIPTILDLFGIKGWKNLYLGTSIFIEDVESIIYSRAYGIFVTDKLICYSIKELLYSSKNFTKEDKKDFINRATVHLKKLQILDKIYYGDYFKHYEYKKPV